jgi:PEP-CTERM motif
MIVWKSAAATVALAAVVVSGMAGSAAASPLVQVFNFSFTDTGIVFDTNLYLYPGSSATQAAVSPGAATTSMTIAITGTITGLGAGFTEYGNLAEAFVTASPDSQGYFAQPAASGPGTATFAASYLVSPPQLAGSDDFTAVSFADESALIDGTPTTIDVSATVTVTANYASVPEPVSLAVFGSGLAGIAMHRRRRHSAH